MDVLKVLFYMAAAALVAALGVTWKDFKRARAAEPPEKVFAVKREIREIELERSRMQADRDRITGKAVPPAASSVADESPPPPSTDVDLAAVDAASTLSDPPEEEEAKPEEMAPAAATPEDRAKAIAAAPVVAKIAEWLESEVGVICTLQIVDATVVKPGTMLSVRRNVGVIARLKVDGVDPDGALATPTAVLGELKPQAGDELILDPDAK